MSFPQVPKKKRSFHLRSPERSIHIAIVRYLESVLPPSFIVHHSRNGGMSKAENGKAKAMGAKAGWPDIVILGEWSVGPHDRIPAIWFLEVKDKNGVLTESQKKFIQKTDRLSIPLRVVRSIDDARQALIDWSIQNRDLQIAK